jgi:hypothetical protein
MYLGQVENYGGKRERAEHASQASALLFGEVEEMSTVLNREIGPIISQRRKGGRQLQWSLPNDYVKAQ